jgi:cation diffusion facilitator family transporter
MFDTEIESGTSGRSVTIVGALVNIFLIISKGLAGVFGHSQALIADAIHSISDLFTDVVVLLGLRYGRRAPDAEHHFGHARIETMASTIVGMALIGTAIYIGKDAAVNIYRHSEYHPKGVAVFAAAIAVALKEALYHFTIHAGRRIKSQLLVANAWHHRSDAFSSVAVLLGVTVAYFKPAWHILDSYAALLVSFFIIKIGYEIIIKTINEFTDAAPKGEILDKIKKYAMSVDGVVDVHDLRARISGSVFQMEIHISVDGRLTVLEGHRIAKAAEKRIAEQIEDIGSVIVHVDPAEMET